MVKQNIKSKDGFTIIEVVLVLAIAGLIFLMVFIAWPALQRSQRDTQRRNDYSALSTAISNYIVNNNGNLESIKNSKYNGKARYLDPKDYINETGLDPEGKEYVLQSMNCGASASAAEGTVCNYPTNDPGAQNVYLIRHANCDASKNGHSFPGYSSSDKAFVIYGYLESGSKTFYLASH